MEEQPSPTPPHSGDPDYEPPQLWIVFAVGGFMVVAAIVVVILLIALN